MNESKYQEKDNSINESMLLPAKEEENENKNSYEKYSKRGPMKPFNDRSLESTLGGEIHEDFLKNNVKSNFYLSFISLKGDFDRK